jgi:20S proteasome alpha/beta subunit
MTIAIGMLCGGGAIIAADTKSINSVSGTSAHGRKLAVVDLKHIAFAIAQSSEDGNASETLVRKIASRLGKQKIGDWGEIESVITGAMGEWDASFTQKSPYTQLIAGITMPGTGTRLYFCEPPSTILPKLEGYVSAGWGAEVANPLFKTLFNPSPQSQNPQVVLREIAYLMYRTKGIPGHAYTGGITDAAFLDTRKASVTWIDPRDLKEQEKASFQLDLILNTAATVALGQSNEWFEHNIESVGAVIRQCENLRKTVFHDLGGRILGESEYTGPQSNNDPRSLHE